MEIGPNNIDKQALAFHGGQIPQVNRNNEDKILQHLVDTLGIDYGG